MASRGGTPPGCNHDNGDTLVDTSHQPAWDQAHGINPPAPALRRASALSKRGRPRLKGAAPRFEMKVGTRLGYGFGMVLAMLIMLTAIGILRLNQMQSRIDEITHFNNLKVKLAGAMRETVFERMIALRTAALVSGASEMQPEAERIRAEAQRYAQAEQQLRALFVRGASAQEEALLGKIKKEEAHTVALVEQAMSLALANQADQVYTVLTGQLIPAQTQWMGALGALIALEEQQTAQAGHAAEAASASARAWMVGIGALATLSGMAVAFLITRKLVRQLGCEPRYAHEIAGRIAAGDLACAIDTLPGDRDSLLYAMKAMRDNLALLVGQVRADTDMIVSATAEIANGNLDLSSRTEEQAGSLKKTASSVEDLSVAVQSNADSAQQANALAASASAVAHQGGAVVTRVVDTMSSIKASARKIVDIIGVVDAIAFQTNILALNAAVESARAGQQGRGFAVVASEVRSLAQRAAEAAREISGLIGAAVEQVDIGGELVDQAGDTMHQIVASVGRVTGIMGEIAQASSAQAGGIEQVRRAVVEMDAMTRQNAALVELAAAAATSLQERAAHVDAAMGAFVLAEMRAPAGLLP